MSSSNENVSGSTDDAMAQIARLREQVEALMRDKVVPMVGEIASQVEATATEASAAVKQRAEALSGQVRSQPLTALAIAAAIGFLIGRASR